MENLSKKTKDDLIAIIGDLEQQLNAVKGANQTLKGDLLEAREDLKILQEAEAAAPAGKCDCTAKIAALREIIDLSCKDHCPHRGKAEACKNCAIHLKLEKLEKKD